MAPEVIACENNTEFTYDNRVSMINYLPFLKKVCNYFPFLKEMYDY